MKKVIFVTLFLLVSSSAFAQMSSRDCFKRVYESIPELQRIDFEYREKTSNKNYLTYNVLFEPHFWNNYRKIYFEVTFKAGLYLTNDKLRYWAVDPYRGTIYSWDPDTFITIPLDELFLMFPQLQY
ncbi:MAG: hypothetical protein J0M18_04760 [Ignavibacteria bacterium]|nr:hypothetical protein [Ignavibacteria bacterium]